MGSWSKSGQDALRLLFNSLVSMYGRRRTVVSSLELPDANDVQQLVWQEVIGVYEDNVCGL